MICASSILVILLLENTVALDGGYYYFAHCEKDGSDYLYIQDSWCKNKFFGIDGVCDGPCLASPNRRYCAFQHTPEDTTAMCEFAKWCSNDGSTPKAKACSYTTLLRTPTACSDDRILICF